MKLKQIIKENEDTSLIKKYFDESGFSKIEVTPDGVNVEGDLIFRSETLQVEELPVKLNIVTGNVDLMGSGIKTLKNIPNSCNSLNVSYNGLTSLATDTPLVVNSLAADGTNITDLSGIKLNGLQYLTLEYCEQLRTLKGLEGVAVKELTLKGCPLFEDDLSRYNIDIVDIELADCKNMPLVFLVAFGKPHIKEVGRDTSPLIKIAKKYLDKGPSVVLDLVRELRDQGFKNSAKVL
jgi:hypothetical protein